MILQQVVGGLTTYPARESDAAYQKNNNQRHLERIEICVNEAQSGFRVKKSILARVTMCKSVSISVSIGWQKRIRAHGECLGVICRRRTWYTAKSSDEVCTTAKVRDIRMGKPVRGHTLSLLREREPGELKHLSTRRKREHSASSGERKRSSPNQSAC